MKYVCMYVCMYGLSCVWVQSQAVSQAPAPRQFYSLPAALEPRHQTQRCVGRHTPRGGGGGGALAQQNIDLVDLVEYG